MLRTALAVAAMACALPADAQTTVPAKHSFVLTGAGSFAVFADLATVQRAGEIATIRSFQVVEPASQSEPPPIGVAGRAGRSTARR